EAWDDAEVVSGLVSVSQPVIQRLGESRSLREALAAWLGAPQADLELMQAYWRRHLFPRQKRAATFQDFWDQAVQDGFAEIEIKQEPVPPFRMGSRRPLNLTPVPAEGSFALVLYEKIGMRDGRHAFNPWLQELPDPVTKAVWDNYVCLAPSTAKELRVEQGQMVRIEAGELALELPALVQPGQHPQVVAVALGYGRKGTDRFAKIGPQWLRSRLTVEPGGTVGKNAFPLARLAGNSLRFHNIVRLTPLQEKQHLALTQTHHTITVPDNLGGQRRHMVRETTLAAYMKDPASGNHFEHEILQLWPNDFEYKGHHWAMAIDLSRCTGCSACVIGCQAENNVPVVGKDEVYRRREMHWIRIDRYYSDDDGDVDVMFQPVMCQHCDHAPCESVCPVLATVHSEEGINQQIYNRCVGTRYCANNCPYKVRRFNWFQYWRGEKKENLVLNPDVTTRSRGVMEKCSLCVQRIQEAKAEAKRLGKPLADGDIKLACEQSCPADAIVFGDMNDPDSRISRLLANPRHYRMLEEMNYRPTVGYLTKVRNREEEEG
ncbi:MAG: 4Fe-4S dicluster domain-containing protein, partial [Chloroflexi bacterium]